MRFLSGAEKRLADWRDVVQNLNRFGHLCGFWMAIMWIGAIWEEGSYQGTRFSDAAKVRECDGFSR